MITVLFLVQYFAKFSRILVKYNKYIVLLVHNYCFYLLELLRTKCGSGIRASVLEYYKYLFNTIHK